MEIEIKEEKKLILKRVPPGDKWKFADGSTKSIYPSLTDALDHEIGFVSIFGEGSKFYLRIKCSNQIQNTFLKNKSKTTRDLMKEDLLLNTEASLETIALVEEEV